MRCLRSWEHLTWQGELAPSVVGLIQLLNSCVAAAAPTSRHHNRRDKHPTRRFGKGGLDAHDGRATRAEREALLRRRMRRRRQRKGKGKRGDGDGDGDSEGDTGRAVASAVPKHARAGHGDSQYTLATSSWRSTRSNLTASSSFYTRHLSKPASKAAAVGDSDKTAAKGGDVATSSATSDTDSDEAELRRDRPPVASNFYGHGFGPAALACAAAQWALQCAIGSGVPVVNKALQVCAAAGKTLAAPLMPHDTPALHTTSATGNWRQALDMCKALREANMTPNADTLKYMKEVRLGVLTRTESHVDVFDPVVERVSLQVLRRAPPEQAPVMTAALRGTDLPLDFGWPSLDDAANPPQLALARDPDVSVGMLAQRAGILANSGSIS